MARRLTRRYVLFMSDEDLSEKERKDFATLLEQRYGKVTLIQLAGNARAFIVRMTHNVARGRPERSVELELAGRKVTSLLTSGSIVKLKRRAELGEVTDCGEIPQ